MSRVEHPSPRRCTCPECRQAWAAYQREWRARKRRERQEAASASFSHGTNGYQNYGCRCDVCKDAVSVAGRDRRERLRGEEIPESVGHGENGYTNYGCRCRQCTEAYLARKYRQRDRALDGAHNYGKEWTGPEIELALRLPLSQACKVLGRTEHAVEKIRWKAHHDPSLAPLVEP